jgi:hypothetical protein
MSVSICPCVRMSAHVSKVMNASENENKDRIGKAIVHYATGIRRGRMKDGGRKKRVGVVRRPLM